MGMTAVKTNFMPDGMTYEVAGKERVVLDSSDNLTLQHYLLEGMVLPSTDDAIKTTFYLDDEQLESFRDLQKAFGDIKDHCTTFYQGAYLGAVNLASSIVDCSFDIEGYLGKIIKLVDLFTQGKLDEQSATDQISAVISLLIDKFNKYTESSQNVCNGINTFYEETIQDNVCMNGADGKSGLVESYKDKYELNEGDIKKLDDDIEEATRELEDATKEYNHDVTVAATTPTYAWFFPFGTIPAAVVAGVYGKRATDAYNKMKKLEKEIETKTQEYKQKMALVASLALAKQQTKDIGDLVKTAITPIEEMKGCWNAISQDLSNLLNTVQEDINKAALIIKDVPTQIAINKWKSVAAMADDYRKRAFISSISEKMAVANIIPFPARNK